MRKPWNNTLIAKFFLSYLAVVALLFIGFFFLAQSDLRHLYTDTVGKSLEQRARLIARILPIGADPAALDRLAKELGKELAIRLTVVGTDGTVLADSDEPAAAMENHASRPEIREALAGGTGSSIRYSSTVGYDMFYRAFRQRAEHRQQIIRVAIPLTDIDQAIRTLRSQLLLGLLLVSTAGLLLAYLFASRAARRLRALVAFAGEISEGTFPQREFSTSANDELNALEDQLSSMSRRLKSAHGELVGEKEKLDAILHCMNEGLLVVDLRGKVLLLNEQARLIFQIPSGTVCEGLSLMEMSRHPAMHEVIGAVLRFDFTHSRYETNLEFHEGRWFRVSGTNLRDAQLDTIGFILVFHDITELKRLERVRADFVANVSHELRTPLTAIRGYVETLIESPPADPADTRQFLAIVERHSDRLSRLTDDLLTLSDLESGNVQLHQTALDARLLVHRVLEVVLDKAKKAEVQLKTNIAPELPAIFGDSDRLQQLLINLIDNAIKYTPQGGSVTVSARSAELKNQGSGIEIAVADTGVGIPENHLPRLTERFYRVDKARSREIGGTGLGLAIVKHIVQAHKGELQIASVVNQGTTVSVRLPSTPAVNGAANELASTNRQASPKGKGLRA
ncbi:MAG: HAMP domain-containing protein [Deltaproteobacteria bacterium]|nr:HAMP domain-containing protein [Deltaproteobacteria bacterium]